MEGEKVCQYRGEACFSVEKISYVAGIPLAFREHDGHRYNWPDVKKDWALMVF
ncbi:MAG: hypothetical protein SWH78_15510 [Thermodesulfobacteriota bacterium]|nr:hypothetical protein [Thermodesulfobacteriota bacterium]